MMVINVVLGFNFNANIIRNINQNRILKECDYEIPDWVYSKVFEFNKLKFHEILKLEETKNILNNDKDNKKDDDKNFPDVGEISWNDVLDKN